MSLRQQPEPLVALLHEQEALRHVATAVAADEPAERVLELAVQETAGLLDAEDRLRVVAALGQSGYVLVPEDPLWDDYDGSSPLNDGYPDRPATWFTRFFDEL